MSITGGRYHEGIGYYEGVFDSKGKAFKEVRKKCVNNNNNNTFIYFEEMREYIEEAEREREDLIMRQKEKQRQCILKRNYEFQRQQDGFIRRGSELEEFSRHNFLLIFFSSYERIQT